MANIFTRAAYMLSALLSRNLYRRICLKRMQRKGLKIGRRVHISSPSGIDDRFCYLVSIGDYCILGEDVLIYAHDASTQMHLGYTKKDKVTIGCRTFVGARTIILAGVNIGDDVIIGAGSVVTHDIPNNSIAVGNPARVIKSTSEYIEEQIRNLTTRSAPLREKTLQTSKSKKVIQEALKDSPYYF
jgi:maltose O-acetyltransferase